MSASSQTRLTDQWGRQMDYLRIAVTDRCNLRCFYCMPAEGIQYLPKKELLTYEEILRLTRLSAELGVTKVRITGGEPFLRKDLTSLLHNIKNTEGIQSLNLTTNGVLTLPYLDELQEIGIDHVNLSLDSLDRDNFRRITRRDEYDRVLDTLHGLIHRGIKTKINMVVMQGKNTHEIIDMAALTREHDISVRFIEEMPFNGSTDMQNTWTATQILQELSTRFGTLTPIVTDANAPSTDYLIDDHLGKVGIIAAFSRSFCGTCNRLRLTATGSIKNCLYDEGVLDIKNLIRSGYSDEQLKNALVSTVKHKEKNGFLAEAKRKKGGQITESMSTIGG
ncbi:cyclic pyranopterin phosphate synthase MoaA [Reichenbachiella sp. 5M10]|uniref:GTP 3',8-cyclase MoaA n=1 Tax=Reichenbachiella sp. 5M10 TaxID=1889772 RepID=UPI000C145A8C|nr:GTP 3',8-cyclase MoaA [Reichenbachiella sp. 5M10]PIB34599.1 cyclic pyranopterin phosphate synthase MoaA [Reichenbachiella sp. 5M10]